MNNKQQKMLENIDDFQMGMSAEIGSIRDEVAEMRRELYKSHERHMAIMLAIVPIAFFACIAIYKAFAV